ncbi:MAG: NAD-dependent epimerase/dehydratase family protein [Thermoplasmata archaeon]|nr:NAD-dependent epimerase/dehydratase family protein [Thermoplasmata archaeon]MBE3141366.1 NAD-dependent epimerase/dehydratase family protein [Thermoplasmata archaeon]
MKAFVSGGAGFIGSHLVDSLIENGHTVTVYDNLSSGDKQFIQHHLHQENFTFIKADLLDLKRVKKEIQGHDIVFHLAANPHVRLGEKQTDLDLNQGIVATYNILEAMRHSSIKKIVFSSSSVVYGETQESSLSETYGPTLPISLYGAGKLGAEGLISAFCGTFDFQTWIYRFANVVGARGTHGVIVDFIEKLKKNPKELEILGDGKQCKPYLYVSDCVDGILFGFTHAQEKMNLFNLSCDTTTTVTRIAEMVAEEMKLKNVSFKYTGGIRGWKGDVPRFQLDAQKINTLGWKATLTSDEAVRKAIRDVLHANL